MEKNNVQEAAEQQVQKKPWYKTKAAKWGFGILTAGAAIVGGVFLAKSCKKNEVEEVTAEETETPEEQPQREDRPRHRGNNQRNNNRWND